MMHKKGFEENMQVAKIIPGEIDLVQGVVVRASLSATVGLDRNQARGNEAVKAFSVEGIACPKERGGKDWWVSRMIRAQGRIHF